MGGIVVIYVLGYVAWSFYMTKFINTHVFQYNIMQDYDLPFVGNSEYITRTEAINQPNDTVIRVILGNRYLVIKINHSNDSQLIKAFKSAENALLEDLK